MAGTQPARHRTLALLAEDDFLIAESIDGSLEQAGFEVIQVGDGTEARQVLESRADEVAVLITDIQLGGEVDGWQLGRIARTRNPRIAVLYITGNCAGQWVAQAVPGSMLLQKPFEPADAPVAARALLDAGALPVATPGEIARQISTAVRLGRLRAGPGQPIAGPVFSLRAGEVWASWHERDAEVKLGDLSGVVEMMRDFVRQTEFAERLLESLGAQPVDGD